MTMQSIFRTLAALLLALSASSAVSQSNYPTKPIRLVVPFAAGGGIDLMARITAQRLTEQLGQQVLVENQGGAGGTIASAAVARAAPDGYTFVFHSVSSAVVNAVVLTKLPYDPVNDFTPVTLAARFPLVMVINPDVPAKNVKEFVDLLKANPGKYSYGSSGVGTGIHLAGELFKSIAHVDIVHVPYKGTSAVMADLLAGRVSMLIDGVPPQVKNIKAGKVRALAVTTTRRSEVLPEVPTMIESGVPGYDIPFWTAIFAPAKTPAAIVEKIAAETGKAMKHPDAVARLKQVGAEGVGSTPAELEHFWKQQLALYGKIVKDSGIKLQNE
ncbi:MAG: tripartite tricarboxylate transporter substrate binding protein [Betaproteobacteria bacterium]|nr:MAG: tripartite tricarboxylate transporter substrate binding protein [Betaproteobacteria bacterium]